MPVFLSQSTAGRLQTRRLAWGLPALLALACLLYLPACGGKRPVTAPGSGAGAAKTGGPPSSRPYTVAGKTYHPLAHAHGFSEEGVASWYGEDFHGKPTASGQTYDMYKLSAAHKLLPLGTKVRVTNLDNGRKLDVVVNDRGPFIRGRVLDLSYGAARQLGMLQAGLARVRVESLGEVPRGPDGGLPGPFYIQVGSFGVRANADALAKEMTQQGYRGTRVVQAALGGKVYHRVQAGAFQAQSTAALELTRLSKRFPQAFLVVGDGRN